MTSGLLDGKAVLVTGAGGRLGREIVAVLSREGAGIASTDLTSGSAESGARRAAGRACAVAGDVSEQADVTRIVSYAEDQLGPLTGLVNAHGIYPNTAVTDVDVKEWDRVFAVNTRGTMLTCQALARLWAGRGTGGSIVNLSSGAANSVRRGGAHYSGSKAAVNSLSFALAMELGHLGIRVNSVEPGLILDDVFYADGGATGYQQQGARAYVEDAVKAIPLGRSGQPSDVAETVAFLLSDRSSWTTGTVIGINGGSSAGRTHLPFSPGIK
jgi:NAD(P)-dependent dehydrogenase (short-subunit alcohol dehydrogenase family)